MAFFEAKVRPVLVASCYQCHSEKLQMRGLRLDSLAAALKGGQNGPALVPGKPEQSPLIAAVSYTGRLKMPPSGKLKDTEIAALTQWVKQGAHWPETAQNGNAPRKGELVVTEQHKRFWSFRPIAKPEVPSVKLKTWPTSPIDNFVLARLEAKGLKPNRYADRRTLIRRATLDLVGLPPTPAEVEAFLNDRQPGAFARVVDRLLASPQYGERWGRHWLDVARYADSNGLDENKAFANAFRYRDYVINAFNKDKPFDQFIKEQIAGDLMPTQDPADRNERITATGYLVLGAKVLAEQDKDKMIMDIVDEQIEVISKSVMGITLACARCHDHKFDPFSTKDYYALAGIFKSTRTMKDREFVSNWNERPLVGMEDEAKVRAHQSALKAAEEAARLARSNAEKSVQTLLQRDAAKYVRAAYLLAASPGSISYGDTPLAGAPRVVVEAESFVRGNLNRDSTNYGQGIGVIHNVGLPDTAEWDISLPKDSLYQLEFRYASGEARPVKLSINGREVRAKTAGSVTGGFFPQHQKWEIAGVFPLKAGKNTLRIDSDIPIPHFDKLLLTAVADTGPGAPLRTPESLAQDLGLEAGLLQAVAANLREARDPVGQLLRLFAALPSSRFREEAPILATRIARAENGPTLSAVRRLFEGWTPKSETELLDRVGALVDTAVRRVPAPAFLAGLPEADITGVRDALLPQKGRGLLVVEARRIPELAPADLKNRIAMADEAVKKARENAPQPPMVMAVEDGKIANTRVHLRGSTQNLGEEVPRRFVQVLLRDEPKPLSDADSGRLAFAEWLVSREHPLTARVAVNRMWQGHFGEGLVRTPDNFGLLGERPTHPELLDWLATTFMENGWSMKKMHRIIMLSAAYQMSSDNNEKAQSADPDNRLFWRMNLRRMEAEPYRDSILAVAGRLDLTQGGTLLGTKNNDYVTNDQSGNGAQYGAPRRSIYLPIIRNALFDQFQAFDMGDPTMVVAKRASTTIAPQALFALNSPFALENAHAFAARLLAMPGATDAQRIEAAYLLAYSRPPTAQETARCTAFLAKAEQALAAETDPEKRRRQAWGTLAQVVLAANEFIYIR